MANTIMVQDITPEQFSSLIQEGIKKQIKDLKRDLLIQKEEDQLLTRAEACKLLKIDSSTLWNWTKKGKVTSYGIVNRRYYKKNELLACLTPVRI
ncbi:helix-turn-helix domain-containing protein [Mangrovimonas xylaniphaga]|uniref:helix-turn-helix domain-containing protein n=1 Tax=Mangrovimonas xylaniphaga TaxID=1645915 RepID=UPI0006B47DE0|nr:helix-turn-helix domain-containing protein [Mangrovimonas xylaniphaga]